MRKTPHENVLNPKFLSNSMADETRKSDFISGMAPRLLSPLQRTLFTDQPEKRAMQSLCHRSIVKWIYCPIICLSLFLSAPVSASTGDRPPRITDFTWSNPWADYFIFFGTVEDEIPEGCTVYFGGLLKGCSTSVDEDGYFYLIAEIPEGTGGDVACACVDIYGQISDVGLAYVF